jgi:hypothetical protein
MPLVRIVPLAVNVSGSSRAEAKVTSPSNETVFGISLKRCTMQDEPLCATSTLHRISSNSPHKPTSQTVPCADPRCAYLVCLFEFVRTTPCGAAWLYCDLGKYTSLKIDATPCLCSVSSVSSRQKSVTVDCYCGARNRRYGMRRTGSESALSSCNVVSVVCVSLPKTSLSRET